MPRYKVDVMTTIAGEIVVDAPNIQKAQEDAQTKFNQVVRSQMVPGTGGPDFNKVRIGTSEVMASAKVHDDYPDEVPK